MNAGDQADGLGLPDLGGIALDVLLPSGHSVLAVSVRRAVAAAGQPANYAAHGSTPTPAHEDQPQ